MRVALVTSGYPPHVGGVERSPQAAEAARSRAGQPDDESKPDDAPKA